MGKIATESKLAELVSLAQEPSSARRRELLRDVTDLFFAERSKYAVRELELFDDIILSLAREMEQEVRAELAERFADVENAPFGLINFLSRDQIAVAEPLLNRCPALSEQDLVSIVSDQGQDHLRAVSRRCGISQTVSDVIVERGDDQTLDVLLRNPSAELSRKAHERIVDRATANADLHEGVVDRRSLPVDLLNEMYFVVEARLRDAILARNAELQPSELQAALEVSRKRLATRDGALPPDYAQAETYVEDLKKRGAITPASLVAMLRHGEKTRFLAALAALTGIDFNTARSIVERKQLDALAIICRASDFGLSMFLTITVLVLADGAGMEGAKAYGQLYEKLTTETAQRTLRFWKIRRDSGDVSH